MYITDIILVNTVPTFYLVEREGVRICTYSNEKKYMYVVDS